MPSLLTYRRAIQTELGPFVVATTTTTASDLVSFTCATLVNANAADSQFRGNWAYCAGLSTGANLSAQRQIANTVGYDPDNGACTVARAYSTSVTSGQVMEISSRLPAVTDELGRRGVREIINDVLKTMPPIDLLPVTGVTDSSSYDLSSDYPWLTEKGYIMGIYYQDVSDDYPRQTGFAWDFQYDADTPRLILPAKPFTTGDTFYIKARRPGDTWIKTGGTWAADTDGLQNDADEALPLLSVVRAQALSVCYRDLGAKDGPSEYSDYYREREEYWGKRAYTLRWWQETLREREERVPRIQFRMPVGSTGRYGSGRTYA